MSFIYFLFLNCRLGNKYAFPAHVTAQASSENAIVIFFIYLAPSLEIELSLPSVRKNILLLSSSEYVSDIAFSDVWISKTASNTSGQHA